MAQVEIIVGGLPISEENPLPATAVEITADTVNLDTTDLETAVAAVTTAVEALTALVGDPSDAAGDPTVIGLLKQIAENTTPAE